MINKFDSKVVKAIRTSHDGIVFDSKSELYTYKKLRLLNIPIECHRTLYIQGQLSMNIDFYLPTKNLWIEVKSVVFTDIFKRYLQEIIVLNPFLLRRLIVVVDTRGLGSVHASTIFKEARMKGLTIVTNATLLNHIQKLRG